MWADAMPNGFPYEIAPILMQREVSGSYMQVDTLSANAKP